MPRNGGHRNPNKFEKSAAGRDLFAVLDAGLFNIAPTIDATPIDDDIRYIARRPFATVRPYTCGYNVELHMPFYALDDPRHKSRHHPHDDSVTVKVRALTDVPYTIELARQAFNWNNLDNAELAALG